MLSESLKFLLTPVRTHEGLISETAGQQKRPPGVVGEGNGPKQTLLHESCFCCLEDV